MKIPRPWFFTLMFTVLFACGKPDEPKPAAARKDKMIAIVRPSDDRRPVIVCFGDSLTAGFGLDPGQAYPEVLQRDVPKYRVLNMGISGDTSQDGLERLQIVLLEKPAIVVVEFGANDGLRGQPISVTEANLRQMIETLQKAGVKVVLAGITLPPNYGPDYIRKFEGIFKGLADQYKVPLIPFLLEGVAGHANLMQKDGLHPTAEGTRIVAVNVMRALEPLL
jgi:acyl-CoA thioesterase-1